MARATTRSDKQTGFALLFGLLGLGAALVMYASVAVLGDQLVSAWGFAAAMVSATVLIVAIHTSG